MSDSPATLASEAKKIHQGLKELLKSKEPYDKEIDFQRKNLRRRYLNLLLVHPYAKESKDTETHLWMQTSYAFIAVYKQRIAALDRLTQNKQQQTPSKNNSHGPVEYRKLLQRFRQFLAEEEKFWTQFLVRFARSFSLEEAQPVLVSLGVLSTGTDGKVIEGTDAEADRGRNHFQFPTETLFEGVPASQRQSRITILSKALICLGDIARYRELYNESGGRPKAGHEDVPGPSRRGRSRKAGSLEGIPRPRNYEKSKYCYEQARSLVPNEGNPSHQLAILANYQKDPFASLVHYYRALCVRQPYETASENMATVMTKTLEQWRRKEHTKDPLEMVPKVRIETLKEKQVVIHAIWHIRVEKMDSFARKLLKSVHSDFFSLISDRHLPEDLIINFIVLSQSALWKLRTIQEPATTTPQSDSSRPLMSSLLIEARMLSHVLSLHKCLLQVGIDQLKEPPPIDAAENDLAQRITAVFRRTLPALRIASKWLRSNYTYLMQHGDLQDDTHSINEDSIGIAAFWKAYAHFSRALARAFPADRLPSMSGPLDEDIEMRGFLPLQNMMKQEQGDDKSASKQDQVHPNVLQLMRISDLLADASSLVQMENSPLAIYGNLFVLKGIESIPICSSHQASGDDGLLRSIRDNRVLNSVDEDELTELTSRTEDDPVRDAFRHLDSSDKAEEEEDEEDEIVYLRNPGSPDIALAQPPLTPIKGTTAVSPKTRMPDSLPATASIASTTAQDLLNDMMRLSAGGPRPINSGASLLFGSEPRHSIWSAAQDEQSLRFSTGAITAHQAPIMEPSIPSSYNTGGMSSQLAVQPPQGLVGAHHRALSAQAPSYVPFGVNDAYLYSSTSSPFSQSFNGVSMNRDYITQSTMYQHSSTTGSDPRQLSFSGPQPMFAP